MLPLQSCVHFYHHAVHDTRLRGFAYVLDRKLLKRMLAYSLPLLVLGIAGILNQVADKIIFPFVYPDQAEAPYNSASMEPPARLPW